MLRANSDGNISRNITVNIYTSFRAVIWNALLHTSQLFWEGTCTAHSACLTSAVYVQVRTGGQTSQGEKVGKFWTFQRKCFIIVANLMDNELNQDLPKITLWCLLKHFTMY